MKEAQNHADENQDFESLLEYLKQNRGFDFTSYKRTSLVRRVLKRMQTVGVDGFENYRDYLEVHPEEFATLFNTILINVTTFFRDQPSWDYLKKEILPRILSSKGSSENIRVWSAGCASGEEAYTLAITLAEVMGIESFRQRVKIYATDVDEEALAQARMAVYPAKSLFHLPEELRDKYFEKGADRYSFRYDLRRQVIFGRHDLTQDAPISHLDLIVCRNTLMYFNAEAQVKILARLHFALESSGFLFLGKAEMLLSHAHLFQPVDLRHRIFTKSPGLGLRARASLITQTTGAEPCNHSVRSFSRLRDAGFDASPIAQLVVDLNGTLMLANKQARKCFKVNPKDVGRPFQDLEISYRPIELRSLIDKMYEERSPLTIENVKQFTGDGNEEDNVRHLNLKIEPLEDTSGIFLGASISFQDVTVPTRLQTKLQQSNQELETALEELQSTNEELETTNEELQSTIEELETTNEELQSTNEEMETMNEELQSTNEELETLNDELRQRTEELYRMNAFQDSIVNILGFGVVVVNRSFVVQLWSSRSEDLWGLRAEEVVGEVFFNLDVGLPVEELSGAVRLVLAGKSTYEQIVLDAVNRRGRTIRCRITCSPLLGVDREIDGVILLMQEEEGNNPL